MGSPFLSFDTDLGLMGEGRRPQHRPGSERGERLQGLAVITLPFAAQPDPSLPQVMGQWLLTLQLLLFVEGLFALLRGLQLAVAAALVHGQRGGLAVGLPTTIAGVGLAVRVDHVVLVEAGILSEALSTAWHSAHVRLLS